MLKIQNTQICYKKILLYKDTNLCNNILNIFWNNGYILGYNKIIIYNLLIINLKYIKNKPSIYCIKLFNKYHKLYTVKQIYKLGTTISNILLLISTKLGIQTLNDCKYKKLNGKILIAIK